MAGMRGPSNEETKFKIINPKSLCKKIVKGGTHLKDPMITKARGRKRKGMKQRRKRQDLREKIIEASIHVEKEEISIC
ncbi:protein translocase subunit SecD [Sesbania bispinosa]|nr:protein translocase subunit SecD [Sesbania bispinosa]